MVAGVTPRTAGFSLIELLVVTAILSALAVGVSLAFARPGGTETDAARLDQALTRARDMALATGARHGLELDDAGWRILRYDAVAGAWQDTGGGRWSGTARPARPLRRDAPEVEVLPDGEISPLRIEFYRQAERTVCRAAGWGPVTCR